jgi:NifU-like protein involved in Fe-S cluster formation
MKYQVKNKEVNDVLLMNVHILRKMNNNHNQTLIYQFEFYECFQTLLEKIKLLTFFFKN